MTTSQYITIPLSKGYSTIIDEIDSDLLLLSWHILSEKQEYAATHERLNRNRRILMHRLILSRMLGRELVKGEVVDHINTNKLDNRRDNLRLATVAQNIRNQRLQVINTSGYKGVSITKKGYIAARIRVNSKLIYLGNFDTLELAAQAYNDAAIKYFKEFARLNIIPKKD